MSSPEAKKARNEYMKKYRAENRERLLQKQREHYHANKDKYKGYQERYWQQKGKALVNNSEES